MKTQSKTARGFTLVEVIVASALLVASISVAYTGFLYVMRGANRGQQKNELDILVQTAMERLKSDLRLSSLDLMYFHPAGAGPYTAISFPLAEDTDGDGAVELDADRKIIWDKTVVYHVWDTQPNQLRKTTFKPRNNNLNEVQRQAQLDAVVTTGQGSGTHNGANATTEVIFENLFDWQISSQGATFDGYAPNLSREINRKLGSCVMAPGTHTLRFEVVGKHSASSGYKVGLDTLFMSPSYGHREAEAQLPVVAESGATAARTEMTEGSWSANHQLFFPANAPGDSFSINMENDRWEETNFRGTGSRTDDVSISYDTVLTPRGFVVRLDGYGYSWYAHEQTGATNSSGAALTAGMYATTNLTGAAVRVVMRGSEIEDGDFIRYSGGKSWVRFSAGAWNWWQGLAIDEAYIAECASTNGLLTPDIDLSTMRRLGVWSGGAQSWTLYGTGATWTFFNPDSYPIDRSKTYVISYQVSASAGLGLAKAWPDMRVGAGAGCYIVPAAAAGDVALATWSTLPTMEVASHIHGIETLYTSYPTNGLFTSHVYDTAQETPAYSEIDWTADVPSGTTLNVGVRTGSDPAMSDAPAWSNVTAMASPGVINPGAKRYVQFQAQLDPDASSGFSTPTLQDVVIRWQGVSRYVDIGGTLTRGPDYGIFKVTVDGEELKTGLAIELEIYRDVRGPGGQRRITSALAAQVQPRNTGR